MQEIAGRITRIDEQTAYIASKDGDYLLISDTPADINGLLASAQIVESTEKLAQAKERYPHLVLVGEASLLSVV